ncbi:hypothetical protein EWB00_004503, partial [Schistosoma japonicum]
MHLLMRFMNTRGYFIQLSQNNNSTFLEINSLSSSYHSNYYNNSSNILLLTNRLKSHLIEFLPQRKFHNGRIYCQISIKLKKYLINTNSFIVKSSKILSRNWKKQSYHDDDDDDDDDDATIISSMGYIDLNIYYGPQINNPENQFYVLYPCSSYGQELKMFCSIKSSNDWYITNNITLWCKTDFNPSGQISWYIWTSNNTQIYLTNGYSLQFHIDYLQSSLEMLTVNSNNLWIIDNQFFNNFNDSNNYVTMDIDYMKLINKNLQIKLWKFTCIASLTGFNSQSANRFIIQAVFNDEGVYQYSITNLIGTGSSIINLKLTHTFTRNEIIPRIIICLISLLTILLLVTSILYIQRMKWFNQWFCTKYQFIVSKINHSKHVRRQKVDECFTTVNVSEIIQNSLNDNHDVVMETSQLFDKPYMGDPMVPIQLFNDYATNDSILYEHQPVVEGKTYYKYK